MHRLSSCQHRWQKTLRELGLRHRHRAWKILHVTISYAGGGWGCTHIEQRSPSFREGMISSEGDPHREIIARALPTHAHGMTTGQSESAGGRILFV